MIILTKFWDKQLGYLVHPLEEGLCLKWDNIRLRGIYTIHKGVKAEYYVGDKLKAVQYVQAFSLSKRVKCDRIVETPLAYYEVVGYPFD